MEENNNIQKEEIRPKIVPSYANKKVSDEKKKTKRVQSKITKVIITLVILLVVAMISIIVYNIYLGNKYKNYVSYEAKMENYGFERMYNNSTPKTTNRLTKSEMVKVVVSSLLNRYDISDIWKLDNSEYDNQVWVDYAENNNLIESGYITSSNQNGKATLMEVLKILSNYKKNVLGKEWDIESSPKYSDYEKYTNDEQTIIKDMVWNKIIDDDTKKLNANKSIVKGELNQLVIRFVEKYNTITLYPEDKLNINSEKLPYNSDIYTYTLANINKKVYEAKFDYQDVSKSILPRDIYLKYKDDIVNWIAVITEYYDTILNVDYNNFNKEEFSNIINAYSYNHYSAENIDKYEKYIKDNKISITGNVTALMPIIYFDGQNLRIRAKLQYTILTSDTRNSILFGDLMSSSTITYENDSNLQYIDIKLIPNDTDFKDVYIGNSSIDSLLVKELQ